MPSRWRATSSRIAKARPSDWTPTRCRSSASSSILGSLDCTSRAIVVLRGLEGLSLAFGLARAFIGSGLHWDGTQFYQAQFYQAQFYQAIVANEQLTGGITVRHTILQYQLTYSIMRNRVGPR